MPLGRLTGACGRTVKELSESSYYWDIDLNSCESFLAVIDNPFLHIFLQIRLI